VHKLHEKSLEGMVTCGKGKESSEMCNLCATAFHKCKARPLKTPRSGPECLILHSRKIQL